MKKLIITGFVGKDAEIVLNQQTDQTYARFSVAVSVGSKDHPRIDWVDVVCNGKLTEVANLYVKKGTKLLLEGFPSVNAYINGDNIAVATMKLHAHSIELLRHPAKDNIGEAPEESTAEPLPF